MNHNPLDLNKPIEIAKNLEEFTNWGLNSLAYIRRRELNGSSAYAIYAANGDQLATAPTRELAAALVLQNDLTPLDAH